MPEAALPVRPVVVFVHIHYEGVWPSLRERIALAMDVPFRLVVTTSGTEAIDAPQNPFLQGFRVRPVANRGRDVLPFLTALREEEDFDIGLKLHGKRSLHREDGDAWRDWLVSSLLPVDGSAGRIVARMRDDARLGLVAPDASLHAVARLSGPNEAPMRLLRERLAGEGAAMIAQPPFFAGGTMFWFRREALEVLRSTRFDDLFAAERGQLDGTAAHAFERLFAAIAEGGGRLAVSVGVALATRRETPEAELRAAALSSVDTDATFNRAPTPLTAFVLRRLWFLVPLYLALPLPLRRLLKTMTRQ